MSADRAGARARLASALLVLGAQLTAGGVALATGFRAVSDDDFARVVHAQQFARAPALDPTGTSWLPAPFWLTGGVMMVLGRELEVARWVAVVLGAASALGVLAAARWMLGDERRALVGALVALALPWSARLGVATVPELPTAVAMLLAFAALAPGWTPVRRLGAGAALAFAALARYEPWLVALPFAALTAKDAARPGLGTRARALLGAAAILPLVTPAAWIAWNAHAHGDAFAFVARVAAYRKAIGEGATGLGGAALEYVIAFLVAEPEMLAACATLGFVAWRARGAVRVDLAGTLRPAAMAGLLALALVLAGVKDGAPTHHPERALLAPLLLAAIVAGGLAVDVARGLADRSRWLAAAAVAIAIVSATSARRRHPPTLLARTSEVAVGREVAALVPVGEKVLLEVEDYGFFAVLAGSGRPEDFVLDRDLDPRKGGGASSFGDPARLRARVAETEARWIVERGGGGWSLRAVDAGGW